MRRALPDPTPEAQTPQNPRAKPAGWLAQLCLLCLGLVVIVESNRSWGAGSPTPRRTVSVSSKQVLISARAVRDDRRSFIRPRVRIWVCRREESFRNVRAGHGSDSLVMKDFQQKWRRERVRRTVCIAGLMLSALAASCAGLLSFSPASAATGFHCPGTPGSASHSFAYMNGVTGEPSPSEALTHFLRTGSDGLHLPRS